MGQYYVIANLDKRAGFSPSSVGSGWKLMELAHSTGPISALLLLLGDKRGWRGNRIALVGDYAESDDISVEATQAAGIPCEHIYAAVSDPGWLLQQHGIDAKAFGWKNVGWLARKVLVSAGLVTFGEGAYVTHHQDGSMTTSKRHIISDVVTRSDSDELVVVNLDKQEKLTPALMGDDPHIGNFAVNGWGGGTLTAMGVLLGVSSTGGGRGGGDFFLDHELVGSWGGDHLAVVSPAEAEGFKEIGADIREVMRKGKAGRYRVMKKSGKVVRLK